MMMNLGPSFGKHRTGTGCGIGIAVGRNDKVSQVSGLRYTGVGVQFMGEAGVVAALGWWIDTKLDSLPWGLVVGAMLGVTLATINLVKGLERLEGSSKQADDEDEGQA